MHRIVHAQQLLVVFMMVAALALGCGNGDSDGSSGDTAGDGGSDGGDAATEKPRALPETLKPHSSWARDSDLAPVIDIPMAMRGDRSVAAMRVSPMPSASDIGIVVYPGAQLLGAYRRKESVTNGENTVTLAHVVLLSVDDLATVGAYYEAQLPEWSHQTLGMAMHAFVNAEVEESVTYMKIIEAQLAGNQGVTIHNATEARLKIMPTAKTQIRIYYTP